MAAFLQHRDHKGKRYFLVKWKDDSRKDSWENTQKVRSNCYDMWKKYNEEVDNQEEVRF